MLVEESDTIPVGDRQSLPAFLTRLSRGWAPAVLAAVVTAATLGALQFLGGQIEQLVGYPPFDLQTPLSLDALLQQAPLYTSEAITIYAIFLLVDTVFPLAAALLLCLVLARSISTFQRLTGRKVRSSWLVVVPLIGAVLDWTENVVFALALADPSSLELWATIAVGVKATKVAVSVIAISSAVLVFAVVMGVWWIIARLRRTD